MEDAENYESHEMEEMQEYPENEDDNDNDDNDDGYEDNYENADSGEQLEWDNSDDVEEESINEKDLDKIVNSIENENLRTIVRNELDLIDQGEDEISTSIFKNMLLDGMTDIKTGDRLVASDWRATDEEVNISEREKFLETQKINNINIALEEEGIYIDHRDHRVREFVKELKETLTDKKKEISGYEYKNEKVISRDRQKKFHFLDNKDATNVKKYLRELTNNNAKSKLISLLKNNNEQDVEGTAKEYIDILRNEQENIIKNIKDKKSLFKAVKDINFLDEEIENIKENRPADIREEDFEKTTRGKLLSIKKWALKNKTTLGAGGVGLVVSIVSSVMSSIPLVDKLKDGVKQIGKLGVAMEQAGKKIKNISRRIDNVLTKPTEAVSAILALFGSIIRDASNYPTIIISVIISLIVAYIIKWRER